MLFILRLAGLLVRALGVWRHPGLRDVHHPRCQAWYGTVRGPSFHGPGVRADFLVAARVRWANIVTFLGRWYS